MTEKILAAQKGFQQAALARIVIHNQDARRVRRRFGQFGWHSPRLDKPARRQKKFSKAGFNAKAQRCKGATEKSRWDSQRRKRRRRLDIFHFVIYHV